MPSNPRTEPTLEDLSAFLDHELEAEAQARIAEHVAGCRDCEARLDGLRQATYAVRALPQETPPRTITIPSQPERRRSWAPVGWLASGAAAALVVVFGVTHLPLSASGTASISAGSAARNNGGYSAQVPAGAQASGELNFTPLDKAAYTNQVTVVDPRDSSRRLSVGTDHAAYSANGVLIVRGSATADRAGEITIFLRRGSYGIRLTKPEVAQTTPGVAFNGSYALSRLPLTDPRAGSYTLVVTWTAPDGSTLIAEVPLTLSG